MGITGEKEKEIISFKICPSSFPHFWVIKEATNAGSSQSEVSNSRLKSPEHSARALADVADMS